MGIAEILEMQIFVVPVFMKHRPFVPVAVNPAFFIDTDPMNNAPI